MSRASRELLTAQKFLRRMFLALPRNKLVYRLAKRYADDFVGELNCDMETNGEMLVLDRCIPRSGPGVVIDVGANTGEWTAAVLPLNTELVIHAFEPCEGAFARLTQRAFPPRVSCHQLALSDSQTTRTLHVYGDAAGMNSLSERVDIPTGPLRTQLIATTTVDAHCAARGVQSVLLLKIDVEGHEFAVLKGAEGMLRAGRIQAVQFEYGEGWIASRTLLKDVMDWLSPLPYRLFKVTSRGLVAIPAYHVSLENFRNSNYVLLPAAVAE